jgi:hypothetical protein
VAALYANNTQLDPAKYHVDIGTPIVRWGASDSRPDEAVAAIKLEKELTTGGWKRAAIIMRVLSAIVAGIFGLIARPQPSAPSPPLLEEDFEVQGMVELGATNYQDIKVCVHPPDILVDHDGSFKGTIPFRFDRSSSRLVRPPNILVETTKAPYSSAVVHVVNEGEKLPLNLADYDVHIDHASRSMIFKKPISLQSPASSAGYNVTNAAQP